MLAVLATASPRRIKASHRRRRKVTAGHFVQRYYDPVIGRFFSADPIPMDPNSGANFNSFWYANNNPYKFTDPDGRMATLPTVTVTGSRPLSEYEYYSPEAKAARNKEAKELFKLFGGPFLAMGSHISDGEYWSAGFEAVAIFPIFKIAKGAEAFQVAKDLNVATKTTAAAVEVTHLHHAWPKYLGGAAKQDLVPLTKSVHDAFHRGLDNILPRQWSAKYYEGLSPGARQQVLKDLASYTKAFDKKYNTQLYDALLKNGFPVP